MLKPTLSKLTRRILTIMYSYFLILKQLNIQITLRVKFKMGVALPIYVVNKLCFVAHKVYKEKLTVLRHQTLNLW